METTTTTIDKTQPKRRSRGWVFALALIVCLVCGACALAGLLAMGALTSGRGDRLAVGDAVGIVRVEGTIASGRSASSYASGALSQQIVEYLEWAEADPTVKAIVLRIDSPGGSVVASDEIYEKLQEIDKPIVASMGETAASGGYYIACAADKIVANPATMTGSIGVISQIVELDELLEKVGVEIIVVKSGAYKDTGGFHRDMTDEEQELFQAMIDEVYEGFVQLVAENRGLPKEQVRELADGRVYSGLQAQRVGLVDELGNLPHAIDLATEMGGIEGQPRLVEYQRREPSLFDLLFGMVSPAQPFSGVMELLELEAIPSLQFRYVAP